MTRLHFRNQLMATLLLAIAALAPGQGTRPARPLDTAGGGSQPQGIVIAPVPWERINISLSSPRSTYHVGQPITLRFSVSRDCYVYLFSTDASGTTRQLFPNCFDTDNFVRARRTYQLPDATYRLIASEPAGPDRLHLIATTERYDWMDRRYSISSTSEPFPVTPNGGSAMSNDLRREEQRSLQLGSPQAPARVQPQGRDQSQPSARVEVHPVARPAWGERFLTINIARAGVHYPYPPSFWDGGHHMDGSRPATPPPPAIVEASTVVVRTSPSGADITVNDVFYGRSPIELKLAPGQYDIVAERRGYIPEVAAIRVRSGSRQTVRLELERD